MNKSGISKTWISALKAGAVMVSVLAIPSLAAFSSGSTGVDGALNITTTGLNVFDPKARGIDLDSDNVFHFTTINIASGATLKMSADIMGSRPVIFLASGNVTIAGSIDLSGQAGHIGTGVHKASVAGAGGYSGGMGVLVGSISATSGEGPGGGVVGGGAGGGSGNPCGYAAGGGNRIAGTVSACTGTCCPQAGKSYGNKYLLPLIGGSGGSGVSYDQGQPGGGGGAGGGAILIASSGSIIFSSGGNISANGGSGSPGWNLYGGGGAGGAIRLVANAISGNGNIYAGGGGSGGAGGSPGYIRVESYATTIPISAMQPTGTFATPGLPLYPPPGSLPAVRILTIDGVSVPSNPNGTYTVPDVTINKGDSCDIVIQANNIPTGTVVRLTMSSEDEGNFALNSTPLSGSINASTATARTKIPPGYSRFNLNASW